MISQFLKKWKNKIKYMQGKSTKGLRRKSQEEVTIC